MSRTDIYKFGAPTMIAVFLITFFCISAGVVPTQAQSFDYESYPRLDFDFISLDLELGLQPQNLRIDGAATYQMKANISGADTVTFYAAHMDIRNVAVNGTSADFMLQNDSLFVPVGEPAEAGQEFEVRIRYSGNPRFGLLKNAHNTVRSSLLPKSQRHWVPIVDNPHVDLKTTFSISVPSGYQVWATGQNIDQEAVSVDVMRFRFESEVEVPASSLALAVGRFDTESAKGESNVQVAVEHALNDTIDAGRLLQKAQDYLGQVSDSLQVDYPYNQLTVLVMDDHQWETKSWAASAVHLYSNRGDLDTQLLRGIIGQWFGVHQREAQWKQADAITLQQVVSYQAIADSVRTLEKQDTLKPVTETIYDGFGVSNWNRWIKGWSGWEKEGLKSIIKDAQTGALQELPPVISWDDYAELWYRASGQRLFDVPEFEIGDADGSESSTENADSVAYKVTYNYNESEGRLTLHFEAEFGVYEELTSIKAYEVYPNGTDTTEVTFTGTKDSVVLQVDPMISTVYLEAPDRPGLYLDEFKPSSFLISELRNAEEVERRATAARKLGAHTDNPDLQLAINDFMSRNLEPEVQAALLSSYADITNGASGTEETFLDALDSDHRVIREAGLMALQNFKGNSKVMNQVEQLALNAGDYKFYKKATQVLVAISSPAQFESYTESIIQQENAGKRPIFAIQQLANMGEVEAAVEKADLFTSDNYSYTIRSMALEILIQHDHASTSWLTRAEELLDTSDPRIRYLVISGLTRQESDEVRNFLSEYRQDEYDERVYQKILSYE